MKAKTVIVVNSIVAPAYSIPLILYFVKTRDIPNAGFAFGMAQLFASTAHAVCLLVPFLISLMFPLRELRQGLGWSLILTLFWGTAMLLLGNMLYP